MNYGRLLIADFGLSKHLTEVTSNSKTNNVLGLIEYIEPQCIKNIKYKKDKKSDIYSLGVLLWEITSEHPPFYEMTRELLVLHVGIRELREQPVKDTPVDYVRLYQECWDKDPDLRPGIDKVYEKLKSQRETRTIQSQYLDPSISNEVSSGCDSGIRNLLLHSNSQIGK